MAFPDGIGMWDEAVMFSGAAGKVATAIDQSSGSEGWLPSDRWDKPDLENRRSVS